MELKHCVSIPISDDSCLPPAPPPTKSTRVCFVSDDTLLYAVGNTLRLSSIADDSSASPDSFIFSSTNRGVSSFAFNNAAKFVAYAPRRLNPEIVVVKHPEMTPVCTVQNGTELEYVALDFSRDGSRLAGLGGVADFKLVIYDLEVTKVKDVPARNPKKIIEIALPHSCDLVSFNPSDSNQVAVKAGNKVLVYKLVLLQSAYVVDTVECMLPVLSTSSVTTFIWGLSNVLFVGDSTGDVHVYNGSSGAYLLELPATSPNGLEISRVQSLVLSSTHLVVGCDNGLVQWRKMRGGGGAVLDSEAEVQQVS